MDEKERAADWPKWSPADEAMFWLNEVEKTQGGANGPTIKLRAALAAAPAYAPIGTMTVTETMGAALCFKHAVKIKPGDTFWLVRAGPAAPKQIPKSHEVCGNCGEFSPGCGGLFASDGKLCRFHGLEQGSKP